MPFNPSRKSTAKHLQIIHYTAQVCKIIKLNMSQCQRTVGTNRKDIQPVNPFHLSTKVFAPETKTDGKRVTVGSSGNGS